MRSLIIGGLLAALFVAPALAPVADAPVPVAASVCPAPAHHAPPAAVKPLSQRDFYGFHTSTGEQKYDPFADGTYYLAHDPNAVVAGQAYARAIELRTSSTVTFGISLNARRYPGYRAVVVDVGIEDRTPVNAVATFQVTADGKVIVTKQLRQGQLARHLTLPFGRVEVFSFSATTQDGNAVHVILGDPVVRT